MSFLIVLFAGFTAFFSSDAAQAQPTSTGTISLQGRLVGVVDGSRQLTFFLHTAQTGGSQVASIGPISTQVTGGVFSATVPIPASTFDGRTLWWSVSVDGGAATARQLVTSVPYAMQTRGLFVDAMGNAGVGLTSPSLRLDVAGGVHARDGAIYVTNSSAPSGKKGFGLLVNGSGETTLGRTTDQPVSGLVSEYLTFGADGTPMVESQSMYLRAPAASSVPNAVRAWGFGVESGTGNFFLGPSAPSIASGALQSFPLYVERGTQSQTLWVKPGGIVAVPVLQITGGSDLAEGFQVAATEEIKPLPGMVMVIDRDHDGKLAPCRRGYDTAVAGVVSGANGLSTGMVMGKEGHELASGDVPLAMTGRVWVLCDADQGGPIGRGDRLTTCATPGYAMRVSEDSRAPGAVIGKAMTELKSGRGFVLVLVNLQ